MKTIGQGAIASVEIKKQAGQGSPYLVGLNLVEGIAEGESVDVAGYEFVRAARRAFRVYHLCDDLEEAFSVHSAVMNIIENEGLLA